MEIDSDGSSSGDAPGKKTGSSSTQLHGVKHRRGRRDGVDAGEGKTRCPPSASPVTPTSPQPPDPAGRRRDLTPATLNASAASSVDLAAASHSRSAPRRPRCAAAAACSAPAAVPRRARHPTEVIPASRWSALSSRRLGARCTSRGAARQNR
jgi:hypothetical protein